MKRQPNKQIGTTPCPMRNCDITCEVFRYREYSDDPTRRRFAGKLYCTCATHGRLDADEFIRGNGNLWTPGTSENASADASGNASTPAPDASPAPPKPALVPSTNQPAKSTSPPSRPAPSSTSPAPVQPARFGFL